MGDIMKEYIFNGLIILAIIFGMENLVSEFRKIKEDKVIITKGIIRINNDLLLGIMSVGLFIFFILSFFITKRDISIYMIKTMIIQILCLGPSLIIGTRNEVRDDGIYIRREVYKWDEIERYQWCNEDKGRNIIIKFYIPKYYDNFYDKEIKFYINIKDKDKLESFLDGVEFKNSYEVSESI